MNGRVYDYNLGRFMSVDPFVHEGSQGINPYSYILNNPLAGTDPTGYSVKEEQVTVQAAVMTSKKEMVAPTGSRIKSQEVTSVSGTALLTNGKTQNFTAKYIGGALSAASVSSMVDLHSQNTISKSTESEPKTTETPQDPATLKPSEEIIGFIKTWEGFKSTPYRHKNSDGSFGNWTVGYGTEITQKEYESGKFNNLSEDEADKLMRTRDIPTAQRRVRSFLTSNNSKLKVNQRQFDALFSLTYNAGYLGKQRFPKFQGHVVKGNLKGMIQETQDIGRLAGHKKRRRAELRVYLYGDYSGKP